MPQPMSDRTIAIRMFLRQHPGISPKAAASALRTQGVMVTPRQVSTVRAALRAQGLDGPQEADGDAGDLISLESLCMAHACVLKVGSIAEARRALDALGLLLE